MRQFQAGANDTLVLISAKPTSANPAKPWMTRVDTKVQ